MRTVKHFLQNALVVVLGFSLGLLLVEGMVRIADSFDPNRTPKEVSVNSFGHMIYTPRLDTVVPAEQTGATLVHVFTNSEGFVGRDYAKEKPLGTERVLALGDSFTAATGVNTENNFVSLLEKDPSLTSVEVMNFGVGGQGTVEELIRYSATASEWEHDVAVVFFFPNDFENNQYYLSYREQLFAPFDWKSVPLSNAHTNAVGNGLLPRMLRASRALQVIDAKVRANAELEAVAVRLGVHKEGVMGVPVEGIYPAFFIYQVPLPPAHRAIFEFTESVLKTLKETAEAEGVRLALVYLPEAAAVDAELWEKKQNKLASLANYEWDFDQPNTYLREAANRQGIPFLDLTSVFRRALSENPDAGYYANGGGHFNEVGHALVAGSVAPFIRNVLDSR